MRVIAAINNALNVRLAVRSLFDSPTVEGLSRLVGNEAAGDPRYAAVHGHSGTEVYARDLRLDTPTACPLSPTPARSSFCRGVVSRPLEPISS